MTGYLWHGKPDLETLNAAIIARRDRDVAAFVKPFEWGAAPVSGHRGHRRLLAKRKDKNDGKTAAA